MKPTLGEVTAAISALVLASLACNIPLPRPAADPPATPIATIAPLLEDSFTDASSGWSTGADVDGSVQYDNGGLHMKTFKPEYFTSSNPDSAAYEDVHLEVTVRNLGSDPSAGFGIVCDQQPSAGSYYYFAITTGGEYEIGKSVMGQHDLVLTGDGNWAATDLIPMNAVSYRLGVDCRPGTLTLYVNGRTIDSVRDSAYIKGEVGVFLRSGDVAPADVLYDDFLMTRLK